MSSSGLVVVDESKAKGYLLVAACVLPADVVAARKQLRELIMPRQSRVHMKTESAPRRREILTALERLEVQATIYRAGASYRTDIARRRACLERLVGDIAGTCERLVLESDETQDQRDRRDLIELIRAAGCHGTLSYDHLRATSEPLLAIPDAVAWAWARGGDWRRRVTPLVRLVIQV